MASLNINTHFASIPFDYLELVLVERVGETERRYDMSEQEFNTYLQRMKATNFKYFQTDSKEYVQGNMLLVKKIENNSVTESKAYQIIPLEVVDVSTNIRAVAYERKKLSTIAFQSTKNLDMIKHKRRLIFRVNNKIYVNFQCELCEGHMCRKVFINFNNSKDADLKESFNTMQSLLDIIVPASTC